MTILLRLDAWLGKTLFHPPIILLCQLTRQSQYAIYRALWFAAACHATYYAQGRSWGVLAFLWAWTIIIFINAVVYPDRPARSSGAMRALWWILLGLGVSASVASGFVTAGTVRNIIILFAEYAATIKTIPPRSERERRGGAKEALNGQ